MSRPRLLVSACLLGHLTRYDGQLKRADLVCELVSRYDLVAVCPEVDCGLPTPRDPMRLERVGAGLRLKVIVSGADHTRRMADWCDARLEAMAGEGIRGCILKSRSPSCGLTRVPRFTLDGMGAGAGTGLFVAALGKRFPDMPLLEDDFLLEGLGVFESLLL